MAKFNTTPHCPALWSFSCWTLDGRFLKARGEHSGLYLRFDQLIGVLWTSLLCVLLGDIQPTLTSANVHYWLVAGFALYGRLGNKRSPVRPWIKCLHRLKVIVLPAKSPAPLYWASELQHSPAGIGARMLNKSREDKDCGICYPDSTVFIPFTLIWHSMGYDIRHRVVSLTYWLIFTFSYWINLRAHSRTLWLQRRWRWSWVMNL